ncbi:cell division topological specificity factor MinE [Rhodoplanes elegans]|uniref:Cell division topological specificity factor n=2 Tax=Rhodoplanes TaxID=29407 RepID=A0A327JRK1_9BRAD|nr:cell division topological specificity factor MinE [Rhodoplanes elegans]MBK5958942.1 cell division topological specificity factor MinE [Rhodoplanes elegans]RAI28245.1 cell division topological specificity factor MinE [Rhodoplanes elegans]
MIWSWFKRRHSAPIARERLQILLAHERSPLGRSSNLVSLLQDEIVAVISRHVFVDPDHVQVKMDRGATISTLEIEIEIPNMVAPPLAATC